MRWSRQGSASAAPWRPAAQRHNRRRRRSGERVSPYLSCKKLSVVRISRTMTTTAAPEPGKKTNRIGLEVQPYRGGKTTLCAGCGHNAISERIIDAFFEMGV